MVGLRRWVPLVAVVALLGAAMLAARYANPVVGLLPPSGGGVGDESATPQASRTLPPTATGTPGPEQATQLPSWLTTLVSILCLAVVALIVGYFVWVTLRNRIARLAGRRTEVAPAPPTLAETRETVRSVVEASLADLDDVESDPRRAVIACWLGLERAAAAAGVHRLVSETSTELVIRMLEAHLVVRAEVLAGLAELYREARYAPHVVDVTMRAQARAALVELRGELARPHVRPVEVET